MRYLVTFFAIAIAIGLLAKEGPWTYRALHCIQPPEGSFIAFCTPGNGGEGVGDYELGGLAYGLEPAALKSAMVADVLVMGNSHAQVAMSTREFADFFEQRKVLYFLFGFGMYSGSGIALHIAREQKIHPKVLIVNADPFFFSEPKPVEKEVLKGSLGTRYEYLKRKAFEYVHKPLCHAAPTLCRPPYRTIIRSSRTGAWTYKDTLWYSQYTQPLVEHEFVEAGSGEVARQFIKEMNIDPKCVIITAVPSSFMDSAGLARKVADDLGSPVFIPTLGNLNSYDGDHLTLEDAGRWSNAFLEMSASTIEQCLH